MQNLKTAVIGVGATGAVLAAALIKQNPETVLVDPSPALSKSLAEKGLAISGVLNVQAPVRHFLDRVDRLRSFQPDVIFIATKTFHLGRVLDDLKDVVQGGTKIVSTHNGLGPEDLIAERFGKQCAFRMSLNFGVSLKGPGDVETAFFNPPNHLGGLSPENGDVGRFIAGIFTANGLETEYVEDIKRYVWKKMIMKCTMASICAVTDRTIKECLEFQPTREIALGCFNEALSVAKAQGYDLGEDYLEQGLNYLEKVGVHKDSMCFDVANKTQTEIDFLGGKVVEYAGQFGIPTPYYKTMTNLVKTMEDRYLVRK